jgi:phosphatidylglycerophosphate synthase
MVSVASVLMSIIGAALFLLIPCAASGCAIAYSLGAAVCIQLRLLFNMLDGLMAVEGNLKSPTGLLYNEIPDRLADVIFLAAAGYACAFPELGWLAAVLAVATAYIRCLGGALGFEQDFCGPIAKPQRMFLLTLGCLGTAAELWLCHSAIYSLPIALGLASLGSLMTCIRRTLRIATLLKSNA